jgi:2-isopropylmalate synthase
MERVKIFDTTLRDGEQSPGATMTSAEKLEIAHALSRLGVDIIEAGFPAASPDDLAAVRTIAQRVGNEAPIGRPDRAPPVICALARATKNDLDRAWEAVREAKSPRLHTFLATSDLHLEHKLRLTRAEVLAKIEESVSYARELCDDVEWSAEDASRSDPDFLRQAIAVAIAAGAKTINVPDTVGYTTPAELGTLLRTLAIPRHVTLSVHCHDDLGLAVANTLEGVRVGARQVEVTINGIGERAGNTSLEEVVMALATRAKVFGVSTAIDTAMLVPTSRLVSATTGIVVPPNKAIVGANAFAHESGIHQDGMLKHHETYEIMRPETVGATQTRLVLGKHSGRAALRARLAELGHDLDDAALDRAFAAFKSLAEKKKAVADADLEALVATNLPRFEERFQLDGLQVACGSIGMPTATVRLRSASGDTIVRASTGTGPVHAAFQAIDGIVERTSELLEYSVHSVTEGIDALGEVTVRIRGEGARAIYYGHAADTDIVVASVRAYLAAINRMLVTHSSERQGAAA